MVRVRWPDGSSTRCYSPSLVVTEHFEAGTSYALDDFLDRARLSLSEASERVRAKYGFPCSAAAASLTDIERAASRFASGEVLVEGFDHAG